MTVTETPPQADVEEGAAALYEGDENPARGNWSGRLDFMMSTLGYAVGLGNVWRFPYLCYQNGGGAFLVPYFIILLLLGMPCFLLELVVGQFSAMSPIVGYRNYAPALKGMGFAMVVANAISTCNFTIVIAWCLYYMYLSMTAELPWQHCNNDFNTPACFNRVEYDRCRTENGNSSWWVYGHGQCITNRSLADQLLVNETIRPEQRVSAPEEYLEREVLKLSSGIGHLGDIQLGPAIAVLCTWLVVCATLSKGIKSSGKVVYFTVIFPYVVLVVLFARGITLPGAMDGVRYYMSPDFSRLGDVRTWELAASQTLFSLSAGSGGLITLASYNRFNNNVFRDTLVVCIGNSITSVFAGFAIFSSLGFLAHELGVPVSEVVTSGSGLAFVAYPELVTHLPVSPLWACLFFLMCFTLGIDSHFGGVENVISSILDVFPRLRARKTWVVVAVCGVLFCGSLVNTTQGGRHVVDLLDYYIAGRPVLLFCFLELILLYYVYGFERLLEHLETMTGYRPGPRLAAHISVLYGTVAPLLVGVIMVTSWTSFRPYESGGYVYPLWANVVGCSFLALCILPLPIGAVYNVVVEQEGSLLNRIRSSLTPTEEWFSHSKRIINRQRQAKTNGRQDGDTSTEHEHK
ncbi:sodium- and chloride-dependent glycine transporter 2-like [Amphibalanus amphitrite]|uniref:sodium- and chloride-dependent glycine transporter 2-like n=1 Tax=Amphibalanus amphitrite TaxID=1232801 RepID=UPI001C915DCC|nr:sodium- and chloride-dependent glycine transporter 2-like [Amphibalanus amphitrite]